jgi:O-antigen/teichoic acid export membrane protein
MLTATDGSLRTLPTSALRKGLRRLVSATTSVALVDQALVSGANFATNILIARTLSVHNYGVFTLAWMAVLFANSLQYALVIIPMASVGPKQDVNERPSYFGTVLLHEAIFACFAALAMLTAVVLSARHFPQLAVGNVALPLSVATFAYLGQDFIRRYFFCIGENKWALLSDGISYLSQLPILFGLSRCRELTVSSTLWVIAVTSFLGIGFMVKRYGPVCFDVQSLRDVSLKHWRISRWLVSSAFMQWGAGNLFVVAAPIYLGAAASAVLRASQNIVAVAHVWFLGLDNVVPAQAATQLRCNGVDGMLRYIKSVSVLWGSITFFFTGLIALFPDFLLGLAYGSKYAFDGYVLRLYALLYLVTFFAGPLRAGLQALEYTSAIFWAYPFMIAFSVALAGPFAQKLGLKGVILGLCGTQLIWQSVIGTAFLAKVRWIRRERRQ